MLDKQGYMHAHACTRPRALAHARTHARAHSRTQICSAYCFSTATTIRERASVLRYTYIAVLLNNKNNNNLIFYNVYPSSVIATINFFQYTYPYEQILSDYTRRKFL
jgi:hypothetical protein